MKYSFENLLALLRSTEGEQFLDILIDENPKRVKEQLCMLNIMSRMSCMSYLIDKTMSIDQVNDFCIRAKASYIHNYKQGEVTIPEWLLNKYFI
jgi:hypothetical protein